MGHVLLDLSIIDEHHNRKPIVSFVDINFINSKIFLCIVGELDLVLPPSQGIGICFDLGDNCERTTCRSFFQQVTHLNIGWLK